MPKKNEVYVFLPQDPTVGWSSFGITVEVPFLDGWFEEGDDEMIEMVRENLTDCFSRIYDDCAQVYFYNEIPE